MTRKTKSPVKALLLVACGLGAATAQTGQQPVASAQPTAAAGPGAKHATRPGDQDGDEIWRQQCSRCHNAPSGFSPRIAGTVIRHMRVRASLTRREEEQLLSFLNPSP